MRLASCKSFVDFTQSLRNTYVPVRRQKLMERNVMALVRSTEQRVQQEIRDADATPNLTFDNWTGLDNVNYIAVCAHFITKEFKLADRCLVLEPYKVTHSASDMQNVLQGMVRKYGVGKATGTVVGDEVETEVPNEMFRDDDTSSDSDEELVAVDVEVP